MTYRAGRLTLRRGKAVLRPSVTKVESIQAVVEKQLLDQQYPSFRRVILLTCFIIFTFIPASRYFFSIRLTPMITMLAIGFVPMSVAWLTRRYVPLLLIDFLVLGFSVWAMLGLVLNHGFAEAIQPAGTILLSTFGAYLGGRLLVRDRASWLKLMSFVFIALVVVVPFLAFESMTGAKPLIKLMNLFGEGINPVQPAKRLGLSRAQGSFEHPILLGIFMASLTSIVFYSMLAARRRGAAVAALFLSALGVMFSLSTGPLLSLNVQVFLMIYGRVFRFLKSRWSVLIGSAFVIYIALDLITTRTPFHTFARYATFSAQSSYNRILIWEFGSASVLKYPWFGIGLGEWERPGFMSSSMDNFWLVQAVRYGVPAFIMYAGAFLLTLFKVGRNEFCDAIDRQIRQGVIFTFVGTMIAITSVHLWNASYIWCNFLLGSSVWLTVAQNGSSGTMNGVPRQEEARVWQRRLRSMS